MTRQNLLAGSLALNVGLLLAIGYQISHPRAGKERTGQLAAMRAAQPQSFKHQKAASSGTSQGQPAPGFNWRQEESSDYSTYIANMRAIGVPEQTIRDVIIADVAQAYEARRAALLATRRKPFMYWETADRRRLSPAEWKQILKRYAEKKAELAQLLTPEEYELYELNTSWTADNLRQAMMAFKPTEEEFREIFKEWRAHDENLAATFTAPTVRAAISSGRSGICPSLTPMNSA